ncbi:PorP/SprF family type IX secretion system membrane protein [Runella sp. SP2]|uniref:PorP/SprF family type IX secretion system membrane protein n=1 Tax=Runella sp. SP2 TaxID=2268026 RepID=UPI000F0954C1|nr:PorP/SprF family type IX secretion system membrane protein [Runella sp. SP2]AYQ36577.1 type IX secretion system membrane protein PorP/SprF [Runella sp. SP2]
MKNLLVLSLCWLLSGIAFGQDPQFSHFFSSGAYHNPAFVGELGTLRTTTVHRSQWKNLANINSTLFTLDGLFADDKVGLGVTVMHHSQDRWYKRTDLAVPIAFKIWGDTWNVSMAFQVGASFKEFGGLGGLTLVDQYAALNNGSFVANSNDPLASASLQDRYFSAGCGLLFDYFPQVGASRWWLGVAAQQGAYPLKNQSLSHPPRRWSAFRKSIHGGWQLHLKDTNGGHQKTEQREETLSVMFNWRSQYGNQQLDLMAQYTYSPLLLQVGYRGLPLKKAGPYWQQDALMGSVGLRMGRVQFVYTYDLTISGLKGVGSHEIGFTIGLIEPLFKFGAKRDTPCEREDYFYARF